MHVLLAHDQLVHQLQEGQLGLAQYGQDLLRYLALVVLGAEGFETAVDLRGSSNGERVSQQPRAMHAWQVGKLGLKVLEASVTQSEHIRMT